MFKHFPLIFKIMKYSALRHFGTLCKIYCFIYLYLNVYICSICLCFFQTLRFFLLRTI
ncbi:unnamed protein product [Brugia pahangi]|uniref:Uncharacterized protein n=1 Tax=Brugia pahangi TaxID=6280 RepID=A0A0N4TRI1_BRUPA|nr:unnamed protein product [Brugia pahangi]